MPTQVLAQEEVSAQPSADIYQLMAAQEQAMAAGALAPPPRQAPPPPPTQAQQEALAAVASVLTARLALFVSVIGLIGLAVFAVSKGTYPALGALAIYAAALGPLVWLAQKRVA